MLGSLYYGQELLNWKRSTHAMRSRQVVFFAIVLCAIVIAGDNWADDRVWFRSHTVITDKAPEQPLVLAEFTTIQTHDETQPSKLRHLYKDNDGNLLVIRNETNRTTNAVVTSFQHLGTGELLTVQVDDGQAIVRLGTSSFAFEDDGEQHGAASVKQAANTLMSTAPASFKSALEFLTVLGLDYSIDLRSPALILAMVFFDYQDVPWATKFQTAIEEEKLAEFDASTQSPNAFDQQFGQSYYD